MATDSAEAAGPGSAEGVPIDVAAEVDGPVLGASCRITKVEGSQITVICTEGKDIEALRDILRRDNAMMIVEVGRVRAAPAPAENPAAPAAGA